MMNIKPISDLRNYNKVLDEVKPNQPVFLTKNGRGRYALVDLEQYDYLQASTELLARLQHAEKGKYFTSDEIKKEFNLE
ncbi:type II toxin-antitoxin system Phd/YefM family antitoxin [Lacticaseibacillus hulanensis]|uniref:type II toxin-antitoxin system Phd/YefM family antitoxin n=1 Tax=Lacticaseibacillus hulanensis TaxID=2493111 RepID=UPI000FD8879C|nr:type II toxin-antitoxin system Phd/YefM family antitoxin [Lacticaseibacillus hulanensis]